jgi:hypothetical protein
MELLNIKKIKNIFIGKKAFSVAYTWIFGLVTLFGLGILYIVFNQVFTAHLVPVISDMVNSSSTIDAATKAEVFSGINKYMTFFNILPFVLFFVVVIYMLVASWRKETGEI